MTHLTLAKKFLGLAVLCAASALWLTACQSADDHSSAEHPQSEHPTSEHPTSEHPEHSVTNAPVHKP